MDLSGFLSLLPIPQTLFEITWTLIGWLLARAFAKVDKKGLDEAILEYVEKKEYTKNEAFMRWLGERSLHFLHHFWMGLLLIAYYPVHGCPELMWFGLGLFAEDGCFHIREFLGQIKVSKVEKEP